MSPSPPTDPTLTAAPPARSLAPVVVAVADGSPAAVAGVLPGDEIVQVNGDVPRDIIEWQLATDEADVELDPWLPAVRQAWRELEDSTDAVLVEASSDGQTVRVEKRGGRLIVHVDADGGVVDVSVPTKTVRKLMARL